MAAPPARKARWRVFLDALWYHHPDPKSLLKLDYLVGSTEIWQCARTCNLLRSLACDARQHWTNHPRVREMMTHADERLPTRRSEKVFRLRPGRTFGDVLELLYRQTGEKQPSPDDHRCNERCDLREVETLADEGDVRILALEAEKQACEEIIEQHQQRKRKLEALIEQARMGRERQSRPAIVVTIKTEPT